MLTRLTVSGFKNLVDVDIRFGPFTCIAGANCVGKSNLFDAISFLSMLAELPLMEAAKAIRGGRIADVASLFHRVGERHDETMTFEVEMIIPKTGADDLGQKATATTTFLRYSLELAYRRSEGYSASGTLVLNKEELTHINVSKAGEHLGFRFSGEWLKSAVEGRRTVPFISTEDARIQLHQDQGKSGGGRPARFLAASLPRTVLSSVNAAENRTAVLARREMQSWRRLQLEPTALREPDDFSSSPRIGSDGSHLAATLHHLARGGSLTSDENSSPSQNPDPDRIYTTVANRLAELIDDVREVGVDSDPQRELWTLYAVGRDGTKHAARSLSDGTLRFLALVVIELDPNDEGVLCLEEPENGIHPERIPAMLRLLKAIAVAVNAPVGPDNSLRQVIINTHSPVVVSEIEEDSLIFAKLRERARDGQRSRSVSFGALSNTWRTKEDEEAEVISKGDILGYLSGPRPAHSLDGDTSTHDDSGQHDRQPRKLKPRRVIDRQDIQRLLNFSDESV